MERAAGSDEGHGGLPMPMAPFEAYMLADHRPDYPMHFYFRMVFRGQCDRDRLARALTQAIRRHPLLRAKVRYRFGRVPVWEPLDEIVIIECQHPVITLDEVTKAPPIDLTRKPGLRTWVYQGTTDTQVLFEFHHSCCDGLGALVFLEDLLLCYHQFPQTQSVDQPEDGDSALSSRSRIPLTVTQAIRKIPLDIKDFFRILCRRPAIASTTTAEHKVAQPGLSRFLTHEFPLDDLNSLLTTAREQSTTLTSILMCEVYRALDQWMSEFGEARHRWIRMGIPASTRSGTELAGACCNQVTIMFLDQHSKEIRQPDTLLQKITDLSRFHRESNIWYSMLQLVRFLSKAPPLMALYLQTNRQMSTTIVSNLGRVLKDCPLPNEAGQLRTGDLVLEQIDALVPMRPGTEVTFGAVTYAGQLRLSMHYKPHRISDEAAAALFSQVVANLTTSTAG